MSDLAGVLQAALGGSYTIERELGGGGMSRVFVATENALGRQVVVKVLPIEMTGHLSLERFYREISLAAQLQHPHIVPLLTAAQVEGIPFFTMPYIRGDSLRARLSQQGALPVTDAIRVLREVASALAFAHEAGVVHRDIKPDNVLMSGGAAMVTDFGVAKALSASSRGGESLTSTGMAIGTPAYMSPEQATAGTLDHRSDIYAWGILAYELLTGLTPFAGREPHAQLMAQVTEMPEPITARREGIPQGLASLVMRSLAKNASDRPQSAGEIVRTLDEVVTPSGGMQPATAVVNPVAPTPPLPPSSAMPGAQTPSPSAPVAASRMSRGRWAIAATGVLALVAAAAAAGHWHGTRDAVDGPMSVAVLPFENVGGDTSVEYLSDGITDGLRGALSEAGVPVAARTSSVAFRGKPLDPREVTKTLAVSSVLTGRVRHTGDRLTVSAELSNAGGYEIWQKSFEAQASNPVSMQDKILADLSGALKAKLVPPSRAESRHEKTDPATYDLYMRGQHAQRRLDKAGIDQAIVFFKQAIAHDSSYAPAHGALSYAYVNLADAYAPPREVIPQAKAAIQRALSLDDSSSSAHWLDGLVEELYDHDWAAGERELNRAVVLDPTDPVAHLWRAAHWLSVGQRDQALADCRKALELDPLSPEINHFSVLIYASLGEPDSAIAHYHRAVEVAPQFLYIDNWVGLAYRMKGQLDESLRFERAASDSLKRPTIGLIQTLIRLGRRDEAKTQLTDLEKRLDRGGTDYVMPELIALGWVELGDKSRAIDYLHKGIDVQSAGVSYMTWLHQDFAPLRDDPRFKAYLDQVNLGPYFR